MSANTNTNMPPMGLMTREAAARYVRAVKVLKPEDDATAVAAVQGRTVKVTRTR